MPPSTAQKKKYRDTSWAWFQENRFDDCCRWAQQWGVSDPEAVAAETGRKFSAAVVRRLVVCFKWPVLSGKIFRDCCIDDFKKGRTGDLDPILEQGVDFADDQSPIMPHDGGHDVIDELERRMRQAQPRPTPRTLHMARNPKQRAACDRYLFDCLLIRKFVRRLATVKPHAIGKELRDLFAKHRPKSFVATVADNYGNTRIGEVIDNFLENCSPGDLEWLIDGLEE